MEIIKKIVGLTKKYPQPVVALGMFDGVHLGHAGVIRHAIDIARQIDGTACVFTFSNHPLTVIAPEDAPLMIGSKNLRREIFSDMGVDVLIEIPFTKDFSRKSPEEFLELLQEKISPAYVVTGPNYTFGRFGRGNGRLLLREAESYGFKAEVFQAFTVDRKIVSSTRIRALIAAGDLDSANQLLGRNFTYAGEVVNGDRRGRKLGFPTANIEISDQRAMLPNGAYVVRVKVRGEFFNGIANVGDNPTFKVARRRLEVFINNFSANIYGEEIFVSFLSRLRDEKKFSSAEELKAQLNEDLRIMRNVTGD
ncbi:MAG: bifunctional riboflavin kinase/FAD synthetase [Selenomonadaceae bacterium]|nr:bifunctional riboflavin kinase/FAD synthetase [Selenomonadaceae bacterium]